MLLPGRRYAFGVILTAVGILVLGGIALVEFFYGDRAPIFPVRVFGTVDRPSLALGSASRIRAEGAPLRTGRLASLLPIHVDPAADWSEEAAPPPSARVYGLGEAGAGLDPTAQRLLERARAWASAGDWARALDAYDRLRQAGPDNTALAIERARALSWAGEFGRAADAFGEQASRGGGSDLLLEAARNAWWAGDPVAADTLLALRLRARPGDPVARELRREVCSAAEPSIPTALRWVSEDGGPLERLILARAYVREGDYARAIAPLREAASAPFAADSLWLELAGAAAAADSTPAMIQALRRYRERDPRDERVTLMLARAHRWAGEYSAALPLYDRLLAGRSDPTLRYERAELLLWSGREEAAERDALAVVRMDPAHAAALKMLGDLARWREDWDVALARYRSAARLEPGLEGLHAGLVAADSGLAAVRYARRVAAADEVRIAAETYGDNQGFRWTSLVATHRLRADWGVLDASLTQDVAGSSQPIARGFQSYGYGAQVAFETRPLDRLRLRLSAGLRDFEATGLLPTWGVEVGLEDWLGLTTTLAYEHGPAARRVATLISLFAETTSDLVQLTATASPGALDAWAQAEAERLSSPLGRTDRFSGSVSLSHPITDGLRARASASALTTSGAGPVLPAWGLLYWTPELYVAPSLGVAYRAELGERWSAGAGLDGGYAFVKERSDVARRFAADRFATFGATFDVGYDALPWAVTLSGSWGGALREGYRAGGVRLTGSYRLIPR